VIGADVYINGDTGNDGGAGTSGDPYKKISVGLTNVGDGDIVWLQDADYTDITQNGGAPWGITMSLAKDATIQAVNAKNITLALTSGFGVSLNTDNALVIKDCNITFPNSVNTDRFYRRSGTTIGDMTFSNCDIVQSNSSIDYFAEIDGSSRTKSGGNLTFTDCDITYDAGLSFLRVENGIDMFKLSNTDVRRTQDQTGNFPFIWLDNDGISDLQIIDSTIDTDISTKNDFLFSLSSGDKYITNLVISGSSVSTHVATLNIEDDALIDAVFKNSTFTSEVGNPTAEKGDVFNIEKANSIAIRDCVLSVTTADKPTLQIGLGALEPDSTSNINVVIDGCEIISPSDRSVQILNGCAGTQILNSKLTGGNHTVALLSNNCTVKNCIVSGVGSLGIGNFADGSKIINNTIVAVGGSGIVDGPPSGTGYDSWSYNKNATIYNNIIVCDSATEYALTDYEARKGNENQPRGWTINQSETPSTTAITGTAVVGTGSTWTTLDNTLVHENDIMRITAGTGVIHGDYVIGAVNSDTSLTLLGNPGTYNPASADLAYTIIRNDTMRDYIDYNCYWQEDGSGHIMSLDGNDYDTLANIQTKWLTWNNNYPLNDANSLIEDPQFKDPDNGDFTPTNPALKLDDNTWIGAIQPAEGPSSSFTGTFRSIYK
jgi:hypothetical protein